MEKQEKTELKRKHTLSIAEKITVSGIENVITISEKMVELKLPDRFLTLSGFGFTPIHIDIEQGNVVLTGDVISLKYSGKADKESFIKKLFK